MFLFSQLHFIEIIVEISILFRLQKNGTEHGLFVMLQSPIRTSPKMLIMKISRWTPNLEKKDLIEAMKTITTIGYYLHYFFIWAQFNNPTSICSLSATEISVFSFIFLREMRQTPTQSQVKLIMNIDTTT
jgi:hypothetical protein